MRVKRFLPFGIFLLVGCLFLCAFLIPSQSMASEEVVDIPRIDLTLNGLNLNDFKNGSKETKYFGNTMSLNDKGETMEFFDVEIKGRGNTTWDGEKRPLQIKLNAAKDLLGLGKSRKWVLLADVVDTTHLRNDVAMILAEMLNIKYNKRGKYVELYVDGSYEGLYYLIHKIEIDKGSVDIRNDLAVLFELEMLHSYDEVCYYSHDGICLVMKDNAFHDDREMTELSAQSFLEKFNKLEMVASGISYDELKEVIDMESLAKYFIINEFAVNPDAYTTSFYMYMDGLDDKIHMGPVWDFDYAFSNRAWMWSKGVEFFSPTLSTVRRKEAFGEDGYMENSSITKFIYYLLDLPEFQDEVMRVFRENLFGRKDEFMTSAMSVASQIIEYIEKDYEKYHLSDADVDAIFKIPEPRKEIDYLLNWLSVRFDYLEYMYGVSSERISEFY